METAFAVASEIGLASACRALGLSRATAYRHRRPKPPGSRRRRPPPRALSDEERAAVLAERFVDASAELVAERLRSAGLDVEARPAKEVRDLAECDAFDIGGATYMFHWLKEATGLVRRNCALLAACPVWLFSCGPLGTETTDEDGRDVRDVSGPREFAELRDAIHPRDTRVFFGSYDPEQKPIGFMERLTRMMPAARSAFPVGGFRDRAEIGAWADGIAHELAPVPASRG